MNSNYHIPVMLEECIEGLNIKPDGIYVDVTFGGGGHAVAILKMLDNGKLVAFDQDEDALINAKNIEGQEKMLFVQHNFQYLKNFLKYLNLYPVDGILADLGVSSHQINEPSRGFSYRFDASLDMRMDSSMEQSGLDIINNYSEEKLVEIFRNYGEINNSTKLAARICITRSSKAIKTTKELIGCIADMVPQRIQNKFYAKVFQSIRIEVNGEMTVLGNFLDQCQGALKTGGRLVVMSYHSLEDRMVKNLIKKGSVKGELQANEFGVSNKPFRAINRKVITPSNEELKENPRSRSAKLRIAERV